MDGQVVNAKKAIANMLNNISTKVAIKLANDITVPTEQNFKEYLHSEPGVSYSFKYVSELEINNIKKILIN